MKINRNDLCPCGSGKKYKRCCGNQAVGNTEKTYVNEAHEWMDQNVLHGRYPDLYGFLILVDHNIPAKEIWEQLRFWSEQYLNSGNNRTQKFHEIIDEKIESQMEIDKRDGYRPSFCHKGCTNCCYQPVACTDEEAQLIYSYCADNGINIDFEKLKRQIGYIEVDADNNFDGKTTWNNQTEYDNPVSFWIKMTGHVQYGKSVLLCAGFILQKKQINTASQTTGFPILARSEYIIQIAAIYSVQSSQSIMILSVK